MSLHLLSDARKNQGRKPQSARLRISRAGILLILTLTLIPALTHIPLGQATKPPPSPPPSTGTSWIKAYNVPYGYAAANSIAQISTGGYVVGGTCTAGAVSTPNCASLSEPAATVVRLDSGGNIQSQTQYLFTSYPYSTPLGISRPTSDGGAIFAGNAQFGCPATGKTSCAVIVKVDATNRVQWVNDLQYSTSCTAGPFTWPLGLQQTTDGGYVLAGQAYAPSCGYNPFVVKLTSSGQIQWQHLFADPTSAYGAAYSVEQTPDGGYIVAGGINYVVTPSYTESDILVFKLDSTGTLVWQHGYLIGADSYVESLALTSDGGFIVSGSVYTTSSSVLLLKLDSAGSPQWAKTYVPSGSISNLNIVDAQQTTDGGYAFAGYYFQNTIYDERAWLVKTDAAGNVQWDKIYGPDVQYSDRSFNSFQQTSDGGFIAAGHTNEYNNGYGSLWVVKTDLSGNISGCSDVKNGSDTGSSATVKVSTTNLAAVKDTVSYLGDTVTSSAGVLAATKEC